MPPHPKDDAYLEAVIPKRISLFEVVQAEQAARLASLPHDPIKFKDEKAFKDGKVMDGKRWATCPLDVAAEISESLASNALISLIDGSLWDMARPLEGDCDLRLFTFDNDEALEQEYGCKLCIGPCAIKKKGFYYDAFYGTLSLSDQHFEAITDQALKAVEQKQPFERIEVTRDQITCYFVSGGRRWCFLWTENRHRCF